MIKEAIKQNRKLFLRFFVSLAVTCLLAGLLFVTASALSADPETETEVLAENPGTEPVDESLLKELIGIDGSQTLEVILIITILSIAPSFLVMLTSFTRIVIVFSFLRNAMQTQSIPPNSILMGLSLFLTVFIMWPTITDINENAYQPYSRGEIQINEMLDRSGNSLKTFMLKNTSRSNMQFFVELKGAVIYEAEERQAAETAEAENSDSSFITPLEPIPDMTERTPVNLAETDNELTDYIDQLGLETVIPAFILSELTRAFQMGFMLFIPFLVIDIVVSSTLMAMGMMMLPPSMISLPFKIMLFVLVDGWQMLIGTLVQSFNI
ncbi:MAG: flagellar type III secretion system pore protein FliP [Ruminiclostridium sp.]|nr:flagellar type III secretion system pore protein FliP [Ruminiclostridium sp.]